MKHRRNPLLRRVAEAGILTAVALILSYLEAVIPLSPGIPGVKLGLSHLVTVFALYRLPMSEATVITLVRVLLSGFLFGNGVSIAYSLSGAMLSIAVMLVLRRFPAFSSVGVSIAGGVAHNLGQLTCAALMMGTVSLGWYLPVLLVSGSLSGAVIGLVGGILIRRVPGNTNVNKE
jgi:heptaprenyl diphosphate synthase